MAIGGKTLGIVSGLAVGLTSGVILAALNPIVPQKGEPAEQKSIEEASVAPAADEKTDPALPKLSMVDPTQDTDVSDVVVAPETEPVEEPIETTPVKVETPEVVEPNVEDPIVESTQTAEPDTLAPVDEGTTELAMVLPDNTSTAEIEPTPEQPSTVLNEDEPTISSEPAQAIELAEPTLNTQSPEVDTTEIAKTEPVLVNPVEEATQTDEPLELSPNDTAVASLPKIEDPDAPKPAVAAVEEQVEEETPNTSGTFKTTGGSIITRGNSLPKIGEAPETGLAALGTGTKSSRFKTIGDSTKITGDALASAEPDVGALVRNANEFPVTDEPLMSVILIDDGKIAAKLPSLKGLNLPLTIAVSLDEAGAQERAVKYRDAGFEVLAMAPRDVKLSLSGGQTNDQVAELLDQYFEIIPTSVGLIDRPSGNLQKDQRLSRAVVKHFAQTGHGLVTYAGGLNGAQRIADQESVSNGSVFRFLDKSGEAGPIVTQQLDRAVREARSKGAVIVMATPSAATLSTLVSWSLSSKARAVTLAPISASLLKE